MCVGPVWSGKVEGAAREWVCKRACKRCPLGHWVSGACCWTLLDGMEPSLALKSPRMMRSRLGSLRDEISLWRCWKAVSEVVGEEGS